ncbi:MAG: BREX-1 system adenine-specific DNA-methyltransferase PglX, partial [Lachnospiraceae bacterium]|nr:BREX-1 system adenine-specific DNA-methyltransferase PglX [Lachnospiraceae bacterium]
MDKNAIKKYAVWARNELIEKVTQKAQQYGIEDGKTMDPNASSVNGIVLSDTQKKQRKALIEKVNQDGFTQVMEEVAYTWFNRFIALRFMEVNGYLPSHVRIFTDENNNFKPQILSEAIHLDIDGLDMEKVYAMKESNQDEELFKYLLITQCNALNSILPGMFQTIEDYTELLLPDYLLREGSVIEQMITMIPEQDWDVSGGGQIEIIGWLYQYYISEKHESVVDPLHGKVVNKDEVPAATQLFTTDWVVRYIVDNSVGRYWIERNPDSNLKNELEYFVIPKDGKIPFVDEKIIPQQVTFFDPCMGSAHFGVYAFDVLEKIYVEYGYSERDAASEIVKNNLFGLDIDERAAQLAYFAIMMKARQYDRRFFNRGIQPHFYAIKESNHVDSNVLDYFANGNDKRRQDIESIIHDTIDAKEYGSIIRIKPVDFDDLFDRFGEIDNDINMYKEMAINELLPLVQEAKILSGRYAVAATNPPYLNKFDAKLKKYIADNYADYKGDLFSVFIYRNFGFCKKNGYSGFMTPMVWMFIKTYEPLRNYILKNKAITTLIQFEYSAFEEATVPICSFVLKNGMAESNGLYFRLSDFTGGMEVQCEKVNEALKNPNCGYYFESSQENFSKIPGSPVAYWVSKNMLNDFSIGEVLKIKGDTRQGMATSDNNRFLRLWYEVDATKLGFDFSSAQDAKDSGKKWFPYNKGGEYRKWYGNIDYTINYENDGLEVKKYAASLYKTPTRTIKSMSEYFKPCLSWSKISSGSIAFRYYPRGFIFDVAGCCIFYKDSADMFYDFGFINSKVTKSMLNAISPTLNYEAGHIASLPVIRDKNAYSKVGRLTQDNVRLEKEDWDAFENSWDFQKHPMLRNTTTIKKAFSQWQMECEIRFSQVKENEKEINNIFINIYSLQEELTPEEDDKDVTVRKADLGRDIRSFISYAVGCMFGRYSLDVDGLVYAGGDWDASKYKTFIPDKDNIIPITDDEYFTDDIVGRFVEFVKVVYGAETLEENLKFIADALGGKGTPREVIRNYFLNDFYKDHCKTYQKRPIYWLFDSGKKNGFKCLIYMHRYQPDTIARIRTDYVHEQQSRYRTAI